MSVKIAERPTFEKKELFTLIEVCLLFANVICLLFILIDLFLAKHNVEYSKSIPRRDKGCTPIIVRLLRQINRIKPCG